MERGTPGVTTSRDSSLRRPMLVAVAAAVVAMLATSFGGGLGIRYVAKTGLTATSVFGLTLLVVGLALAGFAGVAAWRATHRWNRLWLAPMAVVWLVVTWAVALAVMFSYSPRTTLGSVTPADRGLTYTEVTFRTNDG